MATKTKSKKKTKSKAAPAKKAKLATKSAQKSLAGKKRTMPAKRRARKALPKKAAGRAKAGSGKKKLHVVSTPVEPMVIERAGDRARSGGQSGGLQGLSDIPVADSESVDELIEEGNTFEAEVVLGVEDALDPDQEEVHTHETPEDDVPGEDDDQ